MEQQSKMLFVTDSPSPFNYWATCDIYLLIIFQKIHRKQPAKKEVLPIIKKSSFHVSFSQKFKILCWRCCDWWPKKKRRKQNWKLNWQKDEAEVECLWFCCLMIFIYLKSSIHEKLYNHELDGQEKVNYTYKINVKSPNPSTNSKPQNCLFWNKNSMCHLNVCFLRNPKTIAPFQIINFLMLHTIILGPGTTNQVNHRLHK